MHNSPQTAIAGPGKALSIRTRLFGSLRPVVRKAWLSLRLKANLLIYLERVFVRSSDFLREFFKLGVLCWSKLGLLKIFRTRHAAAITLVDAGGKPLSGEFAGYLRALQPDTWQCGTR